MASSSRTEQGLWESFARTKNLTEQQRRQFEQYYDLLIATNEQYNLTTITSLRRVITDHFIDSLELASCLDMNTIESIADVGPGAGFPSIPLKIIAPHLKVLLIEVTYKKQLFLKQVIEALGLDAVEICPIDWRTFLRTTAGSIDLFTSRATFDDLELCRLFRATSDYKTSRLVYWAGKQWTPHPKAVPYLASTHRYTCDGKERTLAFFQLPESSPSLATTNDASSSRSKEE